MKNQDIDFFQMISVGPTGLDIRHVGPVARGGSRFENLLAHSQNQTCAMKKYLRKPTIRYN